MNYKQVVFKTGLVLLACSVLAGCPHDGDTGSKGADGVTGVNGVNGVNGKDGANGINCWDLNKDGVDDPNEDVNGDGLWDVNDCAPVASTNISQNPAVDLNHQHICEALANLGQYPQGCPSASHITPNTGTFKQIQLMFDDGTGKGVSCSLSNPGLLTLEKSQVDQLYYWKLEGGFIASTKTLAVEDELGHLGNSCLDKCMSDPECIGSLAQSREVGIGSSTSTVYDCALFHHSDTIPPYERVCSDEFWNCAATGGALLVGQRWGLNCP